MTDACHLSACTRYGLQADPSFNILDSCYPTILRQICFDATPQGVRVLREFLLTARESAEGGNGAGARVASGESDEVLNIDLASGMDTRSLEKLIEEFVGGGSPLLFSPKAKALRVVLSGKSLFSFPPEISPLSPFLILPPVADYSVAGAKLPPRAATELFSGRNCYLLGHCMAHALRSVVLPGLIWWRFRATQRNRLRRLAILARKCFGNFAEAARRSCAHTRHPRRSALALCVRSVLFLLSSFVVGLLLLAFRGTNTRTRPTVPKR